MCSVPSIRQNLSADENAIYKDYRVQRWITAKRSNVNAVHQLISLNHRNEDRLKEILTNASRKQAATQELQRNVLSIIHIPSKHEVLFYINCRNKCRQFNAQVEGDALLVVMYYLLHKLEELEGPGHTAVCIIDMFGAPMPKMGDAQAQGKMFSDVVDISFPGVLSEQMIVCDWGALARKAIGSVASSMGQPSNFVSPEDVIKRFGKASTPSFISGDLNLDACQPIGPLAMEFVQICFSKIVPAKVSNYVPAAAAGAESAKASSGAVEGVLGAVPSMVDQYAELLAVACVVVAFAVGEYITLFLLAGGLLYLKYGTNPAPQPVAAHQPQPQAVEEHRQRHRLPLLGERRPVRDYVHEIEREWSEESTKGPDPNNREILPVIHDRRPVRDFIKRHNSSDSEPTSQQLAHGRHFSPAHISPARIRNAWRHGSHSDEPYQA